MLDVITEVLERHAAGIEFREENAGSSLADFHTSVFQTRVL